MEKLLIIDGNSLVNRAFYALPLLTNEDGEYSNAVYGFANILIKFITEQKPDYIAVAFDHSRHTFRTDMYAEYKGTRKQMPDELRSQMPILKEMLKLMNITTFEVDGIEADDIIGTISKKSDIQNIILSGDRDVLQLVNNNTSVWLTKKGITEVLKVEPNNMQELYGYSPSQVIDMKSLMGDASDNIPGVAGVGEKTAKTLIDTYKTLDGVYQNIDQIKGKLQEKLITNKENAYLSYKLATIKTDCDIDVDINSLKYDFPFDNNVKDMFTKFQFKSLLKRNELFVQTQPQKPKKTQKVVEVTSLEQLDSVLNQKIDFFAFNFLNNWEFSIDQACTYYVSSQINLLSTISFENVINKIKNILQNQNIQKITYDLKAHLKLSKEFLNIKGEVFDISIANYLINAGEKLKETFLVGEYFEQKEELTKILKQNNLLSVYNNIEMPLTYVLYEMEEQGFKIDKQMLASLGEQYNEELEYITDNIYQIIGHEFNINSPKQVAEVLFDELKLSDKGNKKHSTGIDVLNDLSYQHEVVPLIIRYRKIQKLTSTYLDVYKKLVQEKGEIIHTIFNQTLTSTGRLSSSEPNLQNIPVRDDEGKNLRKLFISRFDDGLIVSADYNQIELRLLAHMSDDQNLMYAFNHNEDIHARTASQIFDIPIEDITSKERRMAKAVNFGIVYGISAYGLSNQIGVHPKSAKAFMDKYFATYPKVTEYMNGNIEFARKNGYAKTIYGRIRKIAELSAGNKVTQMFGERVAMNMPLQGSASDIIKIAMIKVAEKLKQENLQSKLILQIHDELIIDTKSDELDKVKQILSSCMENVIKLNVPLVVNIESGKTWFDAK